MKTVRPYRAKEVYAAMCLDCGEEVESLSMPVPRYCLSCQAKRDREEKAGK